MVIQFIMWEFIVVSCIFCNSYAQYTFLTEPQSILVKEGEEVTLTCDWSPELNENHRPIGNWVYFPVTGSGSVIQNTQNQYTVSIAQSNSYLIIHSFKSTNAGKYRFDIGNTATSKEALVGVITCLPGDYDGELDEPIRCYSSFSYVDLQWYRNNVLISTPSQDGFILHSTPLTLKDDGAEFTCKATHESLTIGTCTTAPFVLTIKAWVEESPQKPLHLGDELNLTCYVYGDPEKYNYMWTYNSKPVERSTTRKRYAIGEKDNILTFRDLTTGFNGKRVTCTVSRQNRQSVSVTYKIELVDLTTSDLPATTTLLLNTNSQSSAINSTAPPQSSNGSHTTIILIGVVSIIVVILVTIFIVFYLKKNRERKYKNITKPECVPLEEPAYDDIKEKSSDIKIISDRNIENDAGQEDKLLQDSTLYDEPNMVNSNTQLDNCDVVYAEPVLLPFDGDNSNHTISYDTPKKTLSLDNIDAQSNLLNDSGKGEVYAKPNKTLSKESLDAMYAKPNKTRSRESIDDLYSKPIKSSGNTPKSERDPTEKNVEGLNYADIDFEKGTFPSPVPKDHGLNYASVKFD